MKHTSPVGQILKALPKHGPTNRRYVVAIAGPPTAGKTTLADQLQHALTPAAAVLGLDAFHFDDAILDQRGHRRRKGAPHTFDVDGYRRTLEVLRSTPEQAVAIPQFDRRLELSRNAAVMVSPRNSIIITEGNYLLLEDQPWADLAPLFDLTIAITATLELVATRITERWSNYGLDDRTAQQRLTTNDLPNAELTLSGSRPADITISAG